ncbi:MAG: SAM-dependent methyltransferase [Propionibacteriaceae bacterium]
MDVESEDSKESGGRIAAAPPPGGDGSRLTYNSPLSSDRVAQWVAEIASAQPATVSDVGCGWATLLLDILAATPRARGTGIDEHGPDILRAQNDAARRGLSDRVTLIEGDVVDHATRADVVINIGAFHAFGTTAEALRILHDRVEQGGVVIFGAEYWEHPPTDEELDGMWEGTTAGDCTDLAGLVDQSVRAGFRLLRVETATRGEWEEFESGHLAPREAWLVAHPNHPDVPQVAAELDQARSIWLRGHRDVMGFAYLTLLPMIKSAGAAADRDERKPD